MIIRQDVHQHFLTPDYVKAMHKAGIHTADGFPMPEWSPQAALAVMDRYEISSALLSISSPG